MKAYEFPVKVNASGQIELPNALLALLPLEELV